ncbi:hypothetical protein WJX74_006934 [Apatococcus lobatus]|uniref:D-isomer specific 2-hydroxyacid dehydrogenase NAD-binding domain-containing protein n=1 Tax=Apatococcus lobatus TaxID=904363 RepID=A0AAW1QV04_9CHLO
MHQSCNFCLRPVSEADVTRPCLRRKPLRAGCATTASRPLQPARLLRRRCCRRRACSLSQHQQSYLKARRLGETADSSEEETVANILVISRRDAPELEVLRHLPRNASVLAIGSSMQDFSGLTQQDWDRVNALLSTWGAGHSFLQELWPRVSKLRWIHSSSVGVDKLLWPDLINSSVIVSNARGVFSSSLAEWALFACSYFAKDLPRMLAQQQSRKWEKYNVEELRDRKMGIIGYGSIGQACARLAQSYGMHVTAVSRTGVAPPKAKLPGVQVLSTGRLNEVMSQSDYIVAALPETPDTCALIDAAAINAMQRRAVFINIGRGTTVCEPALSSALETNAIRGAALDVFASEPLPADSILWQLPNVLVSPHCADQTAVFQHNALLQWIDNVSRFSRHQQLLNVVDKQLGY